MKLEDLTIKEVCSCLVLLNQLIKEEILNIDLKTKRATINVDKTTEYLENQNVKLQQRINKAIEYIKKERKKTDCFGEPVNYLDEEQAEKLLKILKGVNYEC